MVLLGANTYTERLLEAPYGDGELTESIAFLDI